MTQEMSPPSLEDHSYEDIKVGDSFSFRRFIADEDVRRFAALTGDFNPLHTNPAYAKDTEFGKPLVHGMLVGGLFSALVGMMCPGKRALYLSQTLSFRRPLYPDSWVIVTGTVVTKSDVMKVIELRTVVVVEGTHAVIVDGVAQVRVRDEKS